MSSEEVVGDGDTPQVSERVQMLAKNIYDELEVLVNEHGPDCIGNLMPLVVNILESLDSSLSDNQDHLTALMDVTEENQQLLTQYEKEKQRRKETEEKAIQMEEVKDEELMLLRQQLSDSALENSSLALRLKSQNEQIEKMDERYQESTNSSKELQERNRTLIRKLAAVQDGAKHTDTRGGHDDMAESPTRRVPGFQDFTSPQGGKENASRKKRLQPVLARGRARSRGFSGDDEHMLLATTPAVQRMDSPEFSRRQDDNEYSANLSSLADECQETEAPEEYLEEEGMEEPSFLEESFQANEQSLFAEMNSNFPGVEDILTDNQQLNVERDELRRKVETLTRNVMELENDKTKVAGEKESVEKRLAEMEAELKRMKKDLHDERLKSKEATEKAGGDGLRISRLEIAKVLRERNEWKEKYFSLMEQVRMNDELYMFKKKDNRKSRWVDYFQAMFSTSKRRELERTLADSSSHRPILAAGAPTLNKEDEETDTTVAIFNGAGYAKTRIVPTLRKVGRREDEVFMTSVSWVVPGESRADSPLHDEAPLSPTSGPPPIYPNINTCRPMSFQEEGAKILCATAVNEAMFLGDCASAVMVNKEDSPVSGNDETSMSLVWICTGTEQLTKISVLDAAGMGEVLETFVVSSTAISCISSVPPFDGYDPDVLSSLSTGSRKPATKAVQSALSDRPSSKLATVWLGGDSGVLYVHSAVSQWKKCIHAAKLPASIQAITHSKGKVLLLLENANVAVFKRFPDGEWDWDNFDMVLLPQKKNLPVSTMASVKYTVWCAMGNSIHVLHTHHLKSEATFVVHPRRNVEVNQMLTVGDGVWVSFKNESILRLFHATSFTHMQDIDVGPVVHKVLVFGSEKSSSRMPVFVSTLAAAHTSLWVGTENGVIVCFPFNKPSVVGEETGWEVIKEAEVEGKGVPEPFDVRTEEALDASVIEAGDLPRPAIPRRSLSPDREDDDDDEEDEESMLSGRRQENLMKKKPRLQQPFNPFCNVDQVQVSIHCHVNEVSSLVCAPGLVTSDLNVYEPLGGVIIGPGESAKQRPALFVMSCGEGHLDLRTADKVMQTIHARETGQTGSALPPTASIISEKNYVMVWDITM